MRCSCIVDDAVLKWGTPPGQIGLAPADSNDFLTQIPDSRCCAVKKDFRHVYYIPDLSVAHGVVYVGSNGGTLYAWNDATGAAWWTANLGDPALGPAHRF